MVSSVTCDYCYFLIYDNMQATNVFVYWLSLDNNFYKTDSSISLKKLLMLDNVPTFMLALDVFITLRVSLPV